MLRVQSLLQINFDEEWSGDEAVDKLRADVEAVHQMMFEIGCLRGFELGPGDVADVTLVDVPEGIVARRNERNEVEVWVDGQSVTVRPSQLRDLMAALRAEAE